MTVHHGSSKIIRPAGIGLVAFEHTDKWSVFDRGSSPQEIPGFGVSRADCATASFAIARNAGIPTHYDSRPYARTLIVREFSVPGHDPLSGRTHGRVLPLEIIWRSTVEGSLLKRLDEGVISPRDLGFAKGVSIRRGVRLPRLFIECTTKFELVDRHVSIEEALDIAQISVGEWEQCTGLIQKLVPLLITAYRDLGFDLMDGKFEMAQHRDGSFLFVDVFGTQDENRIVRIIDGEPYCKDLLRMHPSIIRWRSELEEVKKEYPDDKSRWPQYPILPESFLSRVARRYRSVGRVYGASV